MMMMMGGMFDTNRDDRVMLPISMCVRELEEREKQKDDEIVLKTMKWNGKSRDLREVRLVKTSGEREERWLEQRSKGGKKWNEETREWIEEIIQDLLRKWDHQTHHHQETQWSLSTTLCWRNDWWSGREWKEGKKKEGGQGMEVIEKTRWEGDKMIVVQWWYNMKWEWGGNEREV